MLLLLGQNHFSVVKMLDFDVFNECVTNRQTDGHSLLKRCEDASKKKSAKWAKERKKAKI